MALKAVGIDCATPMDWSGFQVAPPSRLILTTNVLWPSLVPCWRWAWMHPTEAGSCTFMGIAKLSWTASAPAG